MKRIFTLLFLVVAMSAGSLAQSYQKTDLGIKTEINAIRIEIQFYSPSIVRVLKTPQGNIYSKESLSVIKTPQKTTVAIQRKGDVLSVSSPILKVNLNLKNGQILFADKKGEQLLAEKVSGIAFTDFNDAGNPTFSVSQSFVLDKDEVIYGLGQQQQGKMIQRNLKLHMVQGNTDDYIPFFQSVKGYGLFWDNYSPTLFSDNQDETSFKSEVGECADYYFMVGGNADGDGAVCHQGQVVGLVLCSRPGKGRQHQGQAHHKGQQGSEFGFHPVSSFVLFVSLTAQEYRGLATP